MARKPLKGGKAEPRRNPPRLVRPDVHSVPNPTSADVNRLFVRPRPITTFEEMLVDGLKKGKIPARSIEARNWFRRKAAQIRGVEPGVLMEEDRRKLQGWPQIGRMYLFRYDPKWKNKLPYYDTYPLIIPFDKPKKGPGFLGINFHYLPPILRAKLMDALYDLAVMGKEPYDDKTYLGVSYGILKSAAKYNAFQPCIKHYLPNHVRSRFMLIEPVEWDLALAMPLARFQKATQEKVWRDSRKKVNG